MSFLGLYSGIIAEILKGGKVSKGGKGLNLDLTY